MSRSTIADFIWSWAKPSSTQPQVDLDVDIHGTDEPVEEPVNAYLHPKNFTCYETLPKDLTILAGEEEEEFKVHKRLFISKSKFFKAACTKSRFREGQERLVRLPEIDGECMSRLIRWFYDSRLDVPADIISDEGYTITLDLLNAADYLQLPIVIRILTRAVQNYIWKCNAWKKDADEAFADEQKKVDLMCRLYECGGRIDGERLNAYLRNLRGAHKMGLFMNAVKEVEDCHPGFFQDTMVAVYSTV
ncbi:hypothetical protein TWF481_003156 [Arthrobotrys musiformis]|uniref:BTB domain-containing protein n=1 Tax=Arthrobotrys musiformis TaxID=47236 RepID=A0AAV9VPQ0_9PEZI